MQSLIASSRKQDADRLPLINLNEPLESLLLLKPTAKLPSKGEDGEIGDPSSQVPVSHMGGIKMHQDDFSYKAIVAWIEDYVDSVSDLYQAADALPEDNWYPTQHVIRVKGLPEDWPNLSNAQVFVHRWDEDDEEWSDTPVAFTQSKVTPRKIINGSLFVIADPEDRDQLNSLGESIDSGKVQLRLYLDRDQRLRESPTLLLNTRSPDATATLNARFGKGFTNADVVERTEVSFSP